MDGKYGEGGVLKWAGGWGWWCWDVEVDVEDSDDCGGGLYGALDANCALGVRDAWYAVGFRRWSVLYMD